MKLEFTETENYRLVSTRNIEPYTVSTTSRVSGEKNRVTCGEVKQVMEGQYYHYTSVSPVLEAL